MTYHEILYCGSTSLVTFPDYNRHPKESGLVYEARYSIVSFVRCVLLMYINCMLYVCVYCLGREEQLLLTALNIN